MKPNYVAKKSVVPVLSFWLILFCWLIVPAIVQVVRILQAKCYSLEFYDSKIIVKSGVLNKKEKQTVFGGVYAVSVSQSLLGRIFSYGDLSADAPGKWDVSTYGIKNPRELKQYLERFITQETAQTVRQNAFTQM